MMGLSEGFRKTLCGFSVGVMVGLSTVDVSAWTGYVCGMTKKYLITS